VRLEIVAHKLNQETNWLVPSGLNMLSVNIKEILSVIYLKKYILFIILCEADMLANRGKCSCFAL
jgi:hypothetical protein